MNNSRLISSTGHAQANPVSRLLWATPWVTILGAQVTLGASCPLRDHTGIDCALCGGTRAVRALADGRALDALDHNAGLLLGTALLITLPTLGQRWSQPTSKTLDRLRPFELAVAWTILRNLPGLSILSSGLG